MSLYESNSTRSNTRNSDRNKHQIIRAMHERQQAAKEQEAVVAERQAVAQNQSPSQKITLKNPRWLHIDENNRANRELKVKFGDKILLRADQIGADGKDVIFKIHDNNIPFNMDPKKLVTELTTKANSPIVEIEWEVSDPRSKTNRNREMDVFFTVSCDDSITVHREIDIIDALKAHIVEMEDTLFNHNSSLLLPCGVTSEDPDDNYPTSNKDQDTISGLEVLKSTFEFIYYENQSGRPKRILLMGHSDPSGKKEYNKKLSTFRATTILNLLIGDDKKNDWIDQFQKNEKDGITTYKDRDIQEIVNWAISLPFPKDESTNEKTFNYNSIIVDGKFGEKSKSALKGFQEGYNKAFNKKITVDGVAGKQVAEAIFDLYQWELKRIISKNFTKENPDDKTPSIEELRSLLKWGNPENNPQNAILSCGENWPLKETNPPSKSSYRSLKDRRVELLLLDEGQESQTELCTPETCSKENCPVYGDNYINKEYLTVNPKYDEFPFKFKVYHLNEPLLNGDYTLSVNHSGRKPIKLIGKFRKEDEGYIDKLIPVNATNGNLNIVINSETTFDIPLSFNGLTMFGSDEESDRLAAEERLISLGYYEPINDLNNDENSNDNLNDDTFNLALMRFKEDNNLFISSELDNETIDKLQEKYGC